ncbi:MAG: hypothetical protein CL912_18750 [Deltaproteobacteria bacterium]|nr:hypothetical protein [Deltaproteobacteria bacterium]
MFDLILEYQYPRITYYLDKLRRALAPEATTTPKTQEKRLEVALTEEWLQKLSIDHTRSWIDDNANEFQFSHVSDGEADEISRAALSAQSLEKVDEEVDKIFKLVDQICSLGEDEGGSLTREILNKLLPSLYSVWRSPRYQASIKARLHARFQHVSNTERRKNEVITALKFLCRVYYSVDVFLQAAQSVPIFKSVECIPVPPQTRTLFKALSSTVRAQLSPLDVARSLGLYVRGTRWLHHLESKASKNRSRQMQGDKRHVHAEIQLLCYQMRYFKTEYQKGCVSPYIGCSKLCCLLCWLLLRVHGGYHVRGTHETIMHRWEMSCEDGEIFKGNHIRLKFGLEKSDEMPPKRGKCAKRCRRCHRPSSLRCSSCRSSYCSVACQRKHWSQHVFVCRVAKRPNDVDYLKIFLSQWCHAIGDQRKRAQVLSELYSDDDLCKTFGFNNCAERDDVTKLLCFYTHMISKLGTNGLQVGLDGGNIGDYMGAVAEIIQYEGKETYRDCPCFAWFLHRQSFADCVIPDWAGDFAYQAGAFRRLEHALSIEDRDDDAQPFTKSEKELLHLYSILFREFNNIPDPLSSTWLEFGF